MPAQDTRVCGTLLCFVGVSDHLARLCLKDFTRLFVMPAFGTKSRLSNMLAARRAMALATCQLLVSDLDHAQRLRTSTSCILAGPLSPPAVPLLPLQAHVHTYVRTYVRTYTHSHIRHFSSSVVHAEYPIRATTPHSCNYTPSVLYPIRAIILKIQHHQGSFSSAHRIRQTSCELVDLFPPLDFIFTHADVRRRLAQRRQSQHLGGESG